MKLVLSVSLMISFLLSIGHADAAQKKSFCKMQLQGEIDRNTPSRLVSLYNALNNSNPEQCEKIMLDLNSSGGDVEAAMRAGEFVRQKRIWTLVPNNSSCASACVFILIGGVKRLPGGNIGLHRPFTDSLSVSETVSRGSYERTNLLIKQYLNRMDIPEALLDAMNAVPPGQVKWLDGDRIRELRLLGDDAVYADQKDSASAKWLGISKKEYYLRQQRVDANCGNGDNVISSDAVMRYAKCYEDVMNGRR